MDEMKTVNDVEVVEDEYVETEDSGNGHLGEIAVGVGLAITAGIGCLIYKNRKKLEELRVRKLEKKGYIVTKPDVEDVENVDEDEE